MGTMRVVRLVASTLAAAAICAVPMRARSAEPAPRLTDRSALVVSFEQLFGVAHETIGRREYGITNVGLGATFGPRLGINGLVRGGFTAGGVLSTIFWFRRGELDGGVIVVGPRIGWMFTGEIIGVWPRIGFDVVLADDMAKSFAADLPLTIRLTKHAGLLVGPSMDVPTSSTARLRERYQVYSFSAGLFGAF